MSLNLSRRLRRVQISSERRRKVRKHLGSEKNLLRKSYLGRKMLVAWLANLVAVPENALRLLLSVLVGKHFVRGSYTFIEKSRRICEKPQSIFVLLIFLFRYFFPEAYPIVICYRCFLHNNTSFSKQQTQLLFAACGIAICWFNYGIETW